MSRRKKTLGHSAYKTEYKKHIEKIATFTALDMAKSFILISKDSKRYPKEGEIVALTSTDENRYWSSVESSRQTYYDEENEEETRFFENEKATFKKGTETVRYYAVVDENVNGGINVFDDLGEVHFIKDNAQVVDLYLYPTISYMSTFKEGYDLDDNLLAIRMLDIFEIDTIQKMIDNDLGSKMMYERIAMRIDQKAKDKIAAVYLERGIVRNEFDGMPIINIRFEHGVIFGDKLDSGMTPFANMCIKQLMDEGYYINLFSNIFTEDVAMIDFCDENDIIFDSFNKPTKFDYLVDTRNLMNFGEVDWGIIFKTLTNRSLFEIVDEEVEDLEADILKNIAEAPFNGSEARLLEEMNNNSPFDGTYSDLLYINEESFNNMVEDGQLKINYPFAPLHWDVISNLQYLFKEKPEIIHPDYVLLIEVLGLTDKFS